jgi:SNF2-related domain
MYCMPVNITMGHQSRAGTAPVTADNTSICYNAGVNWLLGKLQERQNVILGDEMGLGKTIQVLSQQTPLHKEK